MTEAWKENTTTDWKKFHEQLGCEGCHWCDKKALFKGACCTRMWGGGVGPDLKKCGVRKDKE